jgi:DNA primase
MEGVNIREAGLLLQEWFQIEPGKDKLVKKETIKASTPPKEEVVNAPLKFALKSLDPDHPYLRERGLKQETIEHFGLGYCQKGLMKGRIAVPIHDEAGALVAYIGRWLGDPPEGEPKYKLPAGFHKSLVLFNFHRAKELAQKDGLILVEGVFDCFKVWQAGFPNVAALLGSRLSSEQEDLIVKALGPKGRVWLMFDEDQAGHACRADVLNRLSQKLFVKVIALGPESTQPNSLSEAEIKEKLQ